MKFFGVPPPSTIDAVRGCPSTTFVDTTGAPTAQFVAAIRDHLFCANLANNPAKHAWSAINDPTNWPTAGTDAAIQVQSGEQELPGETCVTARRQEAPQEEKGQGDHRRLLAPQGEEKEEAVGEEPPRRPGVSPPSPAGGRPHHPCRAHDVGAGHHEAYGLRHRRVKGEEEGGHGACAQAQSQHRGEKLEARGGGGEPEDLDEVIE